MLETCLSLHKSHRLILISQSITLMGLNVFSRINFPAEKTTPSVSLSPFGWYTRSGRLVCLRICVSSICSQTPPLCSLFRTSSCSPPPAHVPFCFLLIIRLRSPPLAHLSALNQKLHGMTRPKSTKSSFRLDWVLLFRLSFIRNRQTGEKRKWAGNTRSVMMYLWDWAGNTRSVWWCICGSANSCSFLKCAVPTVSDCVSPWKAIAVKKKIWWATRVDGFTH